MLSINKNEKRSNLRHRYLAQIIYGNDDANGKGVIRDLSSGGVFVATERKLSLGTEILVTIPFAKAVRCLSIAGIVVRNTIDGFAISFRR